jgi:hypothetical protein
MDEVEINVEHDRDLRLLADGRDGFQNFGRGRARLETALCGELIHQAVGKRIAERHAEFKHVHAGPVEGERELARGVEVWVAGANVNDQSLLAGFLQCGEFLDDAVHVLSVSRRQSVANTRPSAAND